MSTLATKQISCDLTVDLNVKLAMIGILCLLSLCKSEVEKNFKQEKFGSN